MAAAVDTIKKTISTTGTLTPAVQQDVSFVASGTVTDVAVTAGPAGDGRPATGHRRHPDHAADPGQANLTLAKAQATLVSDQTALSDRAGRADHRRRTPATTPRPPRPRSTPPQQQITVDQTSITSAQAAVDAAQTALNSATLISPIDGIVSTST